MNDRGFTLVETIIYSFLVGIVLTSFVYFSFAITGNKAKNSSVLGVNTEIRDALGGLTKELRSAKSLERASSTLSFYDKNNNLSRVFAYSGRLILEMNGKSFYLTSNNIEIENLNFEITGKSAKSVRISLNAGTTGGSADHVYSQAFQTAVYLRE